jgi:hypothetical protein
MALAVVTCAGVTTLRADEPEGWTNLLADNNLSAHWETTGNWKMSDDGVVTLEPREGERGWTRYGAYLWSDKQYDNFEIMFDYRVQPRGNSGFYFNVAEKGDPVAKGIEVQIYDSGSKAEGAKLTDHDSGGVIPGIPPQKNTAKPAGEWNTFHVRVEGEKLTIKLNGEVVNEVELQTGRLKGRPDKGFIGFQDHGLPLSLRNIRVREL